VDPIDHVNLHGGFEFSETHLKVETAPVLTRIVESSFELLSVRISIFEGFTTKIIFKKVKCSQKHTKQNYLLRTVKKASSDLIAFSVSVANT
jgi:hypothetical protein